jgi:hypothetical protein
MRIVMTKAGAHVTRGKLPAAPPSQILPESAAERIPLPSILHQEDVSC